MTNDAFGGARSAGVVAQLDDRDVRKAVAGAGTALVMVGANDFGPAFHEVLEHRARARTVFPPVTRQVRANVVTIVRKLRRIRPGIRVLVADYWGVMKDGAVGRRRYGAWGMRKADQATADANRALREAADTTHAVYVSTFRAFKGPDGTDDPTPLLAPDGDHPNSRGHAVIADAFFRAAPAG
jgi:lysophospholipase L1-like esterase